MKQRLRTTMVVLLAGLLATSSVALAAKIIGTPGVDLLVGSAGKDLILGTAGDDLIVGLAGDDRIDGGRGNDRINGDGTCPAGTVDPTYCSTGGVGNDRIRG